MNFSRLDMNRILNTALMLLFCFSFSYGQDRALCGSQIFELERAAEDPEYLRFINEEHARFMDGLSSLQKTTSDPEYLIRVPVVVHLIGDNVISNAQSKVQEQIDILNEDFRKIVGTNGDGGGVDTKIEFCLAKFRGDGVTTTSGVTLHHDDPSNPYPTMWEPKHGLTNNRDEDIKAIEHWNEVYFLNIYVVENMRVKYFNPNKQIYEWTGLLGYGTFPYKLQDSPHLDGVVIRLENFGVTASTRNGLGRTLTHEVGHWLNLRHVWGDGGCDVDDFVDDTPICNGSKYTRPPCAGNVECPVENASAGSASSVRPIENYMDYSDDQCMDAFTAGQRVRMRWAFEVYRPFIYHDGHDLVNCGSSSGGSGGGSGSGSNWGSSSLCESAFWINDAEYLSVNGSLLLNELPCVGNLLTLKPSDPWLCNNTVAKWNLNLIAREYDCDEIPSNLNSSWCRPKWFLSSNCQCWFKRYWLGIQEVDDNFQPVGPIYDKWVEIQAYDHRDRLVTAINLTNEDISLITGITLIPGKKYQLGLGGNHYNGGFKSYSRYFQYLPNELSDINTFNQDVGVSSLTIMNQVITFDHVVKASSYIEIKPDSDIFSGTYMIEPVECSSFAPFRYNNQIISANSEAMIFEDTKDQVTEINVYPNPTNRYLNLELHAKQIKELSVYSKEGMKFDIGVDKIDYYDDSACILDLEHLSPGIYILMIETNLGKYYHEKFIKI